jgi:hypothetical protein
MGIWIWTGVWKGKGKEVDRGGKFGIQGRPEGGVVGWDGYGGVGSGDGDGVLELRSGIQGRVLPVQALASAQAGSYGGQQNAYWGSAHL